MSMTEWAKNEIEIACKRERGDKNPDEWDYGCACYESAYKAFLSLMDDEHSGFSIGVAKSILNRLIDGKPLSPIEDTPDIWDDDAICEFDNCTTYQCKRMSSLFKDVYKDGTVKYHDVNRFYCCDRDNHNVCGWYNGFISRLLDTLFPIAMPYNPASKPWYVYIALRGSVTLKMAISIPLAFGIFSNLMENVLKLTGFSKRARMTGLKSVNKNMIAALTARKIHPLL